MKDLLNKGVLNNLNLMLDVGNLMLNGSSLFGYLGLLNSLSLDFTLDKRDSLLSFLGDTRGFLLLKLGFVDFGNFGGSHSLLLFLSEDFLGLLNKSSLFPSLRFINGGSLNFYLGSEL